VLASFDSTAPYPIGGLILSGSTLYGTTYVANGPQSYGTVFSVPITGGTPTTLATLNGTGGVPAELGKLLLYNGKLYGTTSGGFISAGTVFSVPITGGTPTVLANLNGTGAGSPDGGLVLSADGTTLYGTATYGGTYPIPANNGVVFSLPIGGGTPTILASFDGPTYGAQPRGDLVLFNGTLYGTTYEGGPYPGYQGTTGAGVVFSVPVTGGTPTVLDFDGTNGLAPYSGVILSGEALYGTTYYGGDDYPGINAGTVFAVWLPEPSAGILAVLGIGTVLMRRRRQPWIID
jgi:uncharacterized repeat protein (TIGR03803 family)